MGVWSGRVARGGLPDDFQESCAACMSRPLVGRPG